MQKPCRQDHTQPSASCTAWGQLARARPDLLPSMGKIAIRTMAAVASQEMAAHLGPVMGVGVACSSLVSAPNKETFRKRLSFHEPFTLHCSCT